VPKLVGKREHDGEDEAEEHRCYERVREGDLDGPEILGEGDDDPLIVVGPEKGGECGPDEQNEYGFQDAQSDMLLEFLDPVTLLDNRR
jgi:hypothetical protein